MKKRISIKLLAVLTALSLLLSLGAVSAYAVVSDMYTDYALALGSGLSFDGEGSEFKILQFSDLEVGLFPYPATLLYIKAAIAKAQPDLIVLSGDNITKTAAALNAGSSISWICDLFGDIPFTLTFGERDSNLPVGKDTQLAKYQGYKNCLAYDDEPTLAGVGSHNLFIYNNAQAARFAIFDGLAFNLWFLDTNADGLYSDQVYWYRIREDNLMSRSTYTNSIPAMAFSHIPFPEINADPLLFYTSLVDAPGGVYGQYEDVGGYNKDVFKAMRDYGAVQAFVSGHNTLNRFERKVTYDFMQGLTSTTYAAEFLQTGGSACKPENAARGARLITLRLDREGVSGMTSAVSYTTEIISYDDALYSADDSAEALAANARNLAVYKAGSHSFFGPLASFLATLASLFVDRNEAAINISVTLYGLFGGFFA